MSGLDRQNVGRGGAEQGPLAPRQGLPRKPSVVGVLLLAAMLIPLAVHFGYMLVANRSFAFRDAAHYYYPLYQWIQREWTAGRVPLWNPQENGGFPVLADATSAVFYPGKLLFALPLDFTTSYKLYIILHVVLAGAAAYRLARHWHASRPAAALTAISYAFGGNVLFQYCNVIYLVGAAWLPLALLAADRTLVERSWRWAIGLGIVLAMMVLGGDPQAAYHAGLLASLYAALLWLQRRRRRSPEASGPPLRADGRERGWPRRLLRWHPLLLGIAAVSGLLLSAVQVLPASHWTRRSERAVFLYPRSIYEIPEYLGRTAGGSAAKGVAQGLSGLPRSGTHHEHTYHFSVGPWRWAECLWPNFSGSLFPQNRRWTNAIPAESRIWTPSIYWGLLPLLLALRAIRFRGEDRVLRWLSWSFVLGVAGSLGWYGAGWLVQETRYALSGALPDPDGWGPHVGGLYWLMATFLPGYAYFRFPAKLLVVAQLAGSLLAGRGFDRLLREGPRRLPRVLAAVAAVSVVGCGGCWVVQPYWRRWTESVPDDALYGPFDAAGALAELQGSFLHAAGVAVVLATLLCGLLPRGRRVAAGLLVLVTAVELAVAGRPWILTAADRDFTSPAFYEQQILAAQDASGRGPYRVFRATRGGWLPESWARTRSPQRHREGLRWERDTLSPRFPLTGELSMVESTASCLAHDYQTVLRQARRAGPQRPDRVAEPEREILDLLGARYLLLPDDFRFPETEPIASGDGQPTPLESRLWKNPRAYPRVWIVHRAVPLEPLAGHRPQAVEERTREVFRPRQAVRDFRTTAVVETDLIEGVGPLSALANPQTPRVQQDPRPGICRILDWRPQRQEILADLPRPGLLVVSDSYASGWRAERIAADGSVTRLPILRTNRILRGVPLPAGEQRVVFAYRPLGVYAAAALSAAGWLAAIAILASILRKPRRTRRHSAKSPSCGQRRRLP